MSILPPKLLKIFLSGISPAATWPAADDAGDPWVGFPYRWTATLTVDAQPHSSPLSNTPYQYDGLDVEVGDWIATEAGGAAWKIIAISSQTASTVVATFEDVDRYNTFTDPLQLGTGEIAVGDGFLFEIGDDGLPILSPVPNSLIASEFQNDLIGRFRDRNVFQTYYRVDQAGHTFAVNDLVYLTSSGTWALAQAINETEANVVGRVREIHTHSADPSLDWFAIRPFGTIEYNISPALPGNPGDLIYLSDVTAGTLTNVKPTPIAKPIYIRLNSGSEGVLLNRNLRDGTGTGARSDIVNTITERDALTPNDGDIVFVRDKGDGEWGRYIFVSPSWVLIGIEEGAGTSAGTRTLLINFDDTNPIFIQEVHSGNLVHTVQIQVVTEFDDLNAVVSVGDGSDPERLISEDGSDLSEPCTFENLPNYTYVNDEDVFVFFDFGLSTQGQIRVTISYS